MKGLNIKNLLIIIGITFISLSASSQSIWTIGPMLHVNFGGEKVKASFGIECAYWNFSGFPYSIDMATEFEKHKIRFYSEIQTGVGLAGIAAGPIMEIQTDKSAVKLGIQGSVWANYFLGFDIRTRYIDNKIFFSPGVYVKGGFNGRDADGEKIEGSSHHDFDFD